ncbi:hypothetical protein ACFVEN_42035 [Streptomyces sp. NPDC057681]|uniref:hypothetical protein n=1 Tax=Streptomyces sp. NPDC057681 TaxID=3346209 RepID=UPI0036954245
MLDEVITSHPDRYGAWSEGSVDDLLEFLLQVFTRPVLLPLLRTGAPDDEPAVRACFAYVESLATDPNPYVESSVHFGILEQFLEGQDVLLRAWHHSLPETRTKLVAMFEEYPTTLRALRAAGAAGAAGATGAADGAEREQAGPTASALVRDLIRKCFPEQRDAILALEQDEREYADSVNQPAAEVGAYTLISEVFVGEVLKPLLETVPLDEELANRCAHFLERLSELGSHSPFIKELTSIRVTDHLLGHPENWAKLRPHAGKLLRREVRERQVHYSGPFPV